MIKWVRTITIIAALVSLGVNVFILDAQKELDQAHRTFKHRDMDQAMRHARRAIFAGGDDTKIIARALSLQYTIAERLGHPQNAMDYLDQAIEIQPACGLCFLRRGDLSYKQNNHAAALQDFKNGFKHTGALKPATKSYYYARQGLSHLAVGETKQAGADFRNAVQSDTKSPLAFFLKSKIEDKLGKIDSAYKFAEAAYRLGSRNVKFFSTPEGDMWLRYYVDLKIRHAAAHR